jgi:hypothetical protein
MNINLSDIFTFDFQFINEIEGILNLLSIFTIIYIIISILLYYAIFYVGESAYIRSTKLPKILNEDQTDARNNEGTTIKRVLLIIAHPDDECMFFGPTLVTLAQNQNYRIFVLCLSKGMWIFLVSNVLWQLTV